MSTINSLIAAHPAWEFVETVVGSTATNITDVYKCLGSLNSFGTDFFVGIGRTGATPGTATVGMFIGETYDSGAKTFGKGAPWCAYNTALTVAADFSYGTARHVANETSMVATTDGFLRSVGGHSAHARAPGLASTNFSWWLSVTNDRIVYGTSNGGGLLSVYGGLYDSFHAVAIDPFPLVACSLWPALLTSAYDPRLHATASPGGAFTRDAALAGTIAGAFRGGVSGHPWTQDHGSQAGYWSSAALSKEPMSGKWWPSRAMVYPESRAGAIKGLLKPDVLVLDMGEVGEVQGDTLTIDGVVHTQICGAWGVSQHTDAGSLVNRTKSTWVSQAA
jgi:hypothetical protein